MPNWKRRDYTQEEFIEVWNASDSIAEVCRRLGRVPAGGNYKTIHAAAKELGLTTSHMTGQNWWTPENRPKVPVKHVSEYLVEYSTIKSDALKKRLIKEGYLKEFCVSCRGTMWSALGKTSKIPLELDHINGVNTDNRLANLRLLCPNCHAFTDTYRGKGKRGRVSELVYEFPLKGNAEKHRSSNLLTPTKCIYCNLPCFRYNYWHKKCLTCVDCNNKSTALRCKPCANKTNRATKIDWPDTEYLRTRLRTTSMLQLSRELGVSDNAIRKHLRKYQ